MRSRLLLVIAGALLAQSWVVRAQVSPTAPLWAPDQPVAPAAPPAADPAQPAPAPAPLPEPAPPVRTEVIGDDHVVAASTVEPPAPASVAPQSEPADTEQDLSEWMLQHRRFSTREGTTGGLWIEDPSSGAVGA